MNLAALIIYLKAAARKLSDIDAQTTTMNGVPALSAIQQLKSIGVQLAVTTDGSGNILFQITA